MQSWGVASPKTPNLDPGALMFSYSVFLLPNLARNCSPFIRLTKLRLNFEFEAVQKYVKARFEAKPHQWLLSLRSFACSAVLTRTSIWKEGKLTGLTKQEKRRCCNSYSYLQSSVLFAPSGRRASCHRRYLLNQRSPYFCW